MVTHYFGHHGEREVRRRKKEKRGEIPLSQSPIYSFKDMPPMIKLLSIRPYLHHFHPYLRSDNSLLFNSATG